MMDMDMDIAASLTSVMAASTAAPMSMGGDSNCKLSVSSCTACFLVTTTLTVYSDVVKLAHNRRMFPLINLQNPLLIRLLRCLSRRLPPRHLSGIPPPLTTVLRPLFASSKYFLAGKRVCGTGRGDGGEAAR